MTLRSFRVLLTVFFPASVLFVRAGTGERAREAVLSLETSWVCGLSTGTEALSPGLESWLCCGSGPGTSEHLGAVIPPVGITPPSPGAIEGFDEDRFVEDTGWGQNLSAATLGHTAWSRYFREHTGYSMDKDGA